MLSVFSFSSLALVAQVVLSKLITVAPHNVAINMIVVTPIEADSPKMQGGFLQLYQPEVDVICLLFPGLEVGAKVLHFQVQGAVFNTQ